MMIMKLYGVVLLWAIQMKDDPINQYRTSREDIDKFVSFLR